MRDIAELVLPWVVSTWAIFALVRWDEGKLAPEELARAWPDASRLAAIVFFGVFSVPVHFGRTRRSAWGVCIGIACGVLVFALGQLVAMVVDQVVPE